jgi:hypothetical protein
MDDWLILLFLLEYRRRMVRRRRRHAELLERAAEARAAYAALLLGRRRIRHHIDPPDWWDTYVRNSSGLMFRNMLRLSRSNMGLLMHSIRLCETTRWDAGERLLLHGRIRQNPTDAFPSDWDDVCYRKVAVCLYWLAHGDTQRDVSYHVAKSYSTVSRVNHQVCQAIVHYLKDEYISWPIGDDLERVLLGFLEAGAPGAVVILDGTYFEVGVDTAARTSMYCRKGYYAINALVSLYLWNHCSVYIYVWQMCVCCAVWRGLEKGDNLRFHVGRRQQRQSDVQEVIDGSKSHQLLP